MQRKWLLNIILILFTFSAHAATPLKNQGSCARIIGSWYGTFTFKDPQTCHLYHGCNHSISIHVKQQSSQTFQADITPKVGPRGTFMINCDDGKITSPSHPGSTITLECPDATICIVKYNDDTKYATLMGAGID